ncbi:hypothetical protein [Paenibacillus lutimineralis]|uniref:Uncharacterized protein n=1 Tax=Paenibacillus lutimineralis TaxID=2707005 RepID=A0A3S9USR8_9BACL|nr:hypothetical protein [Paenibacillus lutimineralis]AZS13304.1 hypothetical protein EI981_01675 [Paenibacillus lutimineralis]
MNPESILRKYFNKLNYDEVVQKLKEIGLFPQPKEGKKKRYSKQELLPYFLELKKSVTEKELISFVEYSVTKKSKGLPAYTHKLSNTSFFNGKGEKELRTYFKKEEHAVSSVYQVSSVLECMDNNVVHLLLIVKEYEGQWLTGEKTLDRLTAINNCRVKIDLSKKVVTIFSGDDEVHSIIRNFLTSIFRLPIVDCRILNVRSGLSWEDNVSYKTALFLDLVNNRLKVKNIGASFKEIKFKVGNDEIKDVTINGRDIINYPLACEYITLGKDIVQFKTSISYKAFKLSCSFALKGKALDILKIVVADTSNDELRNEVIELIQDEYIAMCEHGISDLNNIKILLEQVLIRFQEKEQFLSEIVELNTVSNVEVIGNILGGVSSSHKQEIRKYLENTRVILESIGYEDIDGVMSPIEKWLQK